MSESELPDESQQPIPDSRAGDVRTWWHPLFARPAQRHFDPYCAMKDEIQLGRLPLRLDAGLFRESDAKLPERATRGMPALAERLRRYNLIEFKAPTDRLEASDLDVFLAHTHLWRAQQSSTPRPSEMALLIVAPELTTDFRRAVQNSDATIEQERKGVHRIDGLMFSLWVLETDQLAGNEEPVLTLFSRVLLEEPHRIMEELTSQGHTDILYYVLQQIQFFRRGWENFIMQHKDTHLMDQLEEDIKESLLTMVTPEERLKGLTAEQVLQHFSAEERLKDLTPEQVLQHFSSEEVLQHFSPEERLKDLTPEQLVKHISMQELLKSLSPEEIAQLKRFLDSQQNPPQTP